MISKLFKNSLWQSIMEVINSKQIVLRMSNQNAYSKNNYFEILNVLRTLFVEKDFTTRVIRFQLKIFLFISVVYQFEL